jgi:hypothetical protein
MSTLPSKRTKVNALSSLAVESSPSTPGRVRNCSSMMRTTFCSFSGALAPGLATHTCRPGSTKPSGMSWTGMRM